MYNSHMYLGYMAFSTSLTKQILDMGGIDETVSCCCFFHINIKIRQYFVEKYTNLYPCINDRICMRNII